MKYNIALKYDKETTQEIFSIHKKLVDNLEVEHGINKKIFPHTTIVKFETQEELSEAQQKTVIQDVNKEIKVDFSGITILPSYSGGYWVEISVLKSKELIDLQQNVLNNLKDYKILSGINNRFRPHITFAKTKTGNLNFEELDYDILRKKKVVGKIEISK